MTSAASTTRAAVSDAIVPEDEQRKLPYDRALELGCAAPAFSC